MIVEEGDDGDDDDEDDDNGGDNNGTGIVKAVLRTTATALVGEGIGAAAEGRNGPGMGAGANENDWVALKGSLPSFLEVVDDDDEDEDDVLATAKVSYSPLPAAVITPPVIGEGEGGCGLYPDMEEGEVEEMGEMGEIAIVPPEVEEGEGGSKNPVMTRK
ncbi:hypothetical protein EDD11_003657 [Mortierella claussenii]|nr:hypothetical protein EDD11_003657 [Mortierella claussenii]